MTYPDRTRARARRRRRLRGTVLAGVLLVVVFSVGIALGEALHDNPTPGGTQTLVRTLVPLQVAPASRTTVTVTTP